jgi:hypothetical protein
LTVHPDYILSLGENADCLARLMTAFLMAASARGQVGAKTLTSGADPSSAIELELLDAMILKAVLHRWHSGGRPANRLGADRSVLPRTGHGAFALFR